MFKFRFSDGKAIQAETVEEFIRKMRNTSYSESKNVKDFMEGCSERANKMNIEIRTDDPYNFLDDLIKAGIVRIEGQEESN